MKQAQIYTQRQEEEQINVENKQRFKGDTHSERKKGHKIICSGIEMKV